MIFYLWAWVIWRIRERYIDLNTRFTQTWTLITKIFLSSSCVIFICDHWTEEQNKTIIKPACPFCQDWVFCVWGRRGEKGRWKRKSRVSFFKGELNSNTDKVIASLLVTLLSSSIICAHHHSNWNLMCTIASQYTLLTISLLFIFWIKFPLCDTVFLPQRLCRYLEGSFVKKGVVC